VGGEEGRPSGGVLAVHLRPRVVDVEVEVSAHEHGVTVDWAFLQPP